MKPLGARIALPVLALLLVVAGAIAIVYGSESLSLGSVIDVLTGGAGDKPSNRIIIMRVRLPRVLLAAIVGAALAVAGVAFQGLLRNPLADPFIVGTSSGAALAAALVIGSGIADSASGPYFMPFAAFLGSLAALVCVYALAHTGGRVPVETLLLSGVIVNAFLFALVLLVLAISPLREVEILLWLMGSLALGVRPGLIPLVGTLVLVGTTAVWMMSRDLDAMSLGEQQASHLGVDTERMKRRLFVVVSIIVGGAVSVSGIIGFVGLIVPHLARMAIGAKHRALVPAAALLGAVFLVVADIVARTALDSSQELPVGVVTALTGAPFFIYMLRKRKRAF